MADRRDIEEFTKLVETAREPFFHHGVPVAIVPEGYTMWPLETEKYQDTPNRRRGKLVVRDVASFVVYVNRHRDAGSLVLVDPGEGRRITAYLNHHEPAENGIDEPLPGWGDHIVVFEPRLTPGWTGWTGMGDTWMNQESLAEFLEERIGEIAEPDGATLVEIATQLKLTIGTEYERAINLTNGQIQLVYKENIQTSIEIPTHFTISVKPFDGAEAVTLHARLRIRKPDAKGEVFFMWKLGEAVRFELDRVYDKLAQEIQVATEVSVLRGSWTP